MEVVERNRTILIHAGEKFPIAKTLVDTGGIMALIWGVFAVLVLFSSFGTGEMVLCFIALTLLLVIPVGLAVVIRKSRRYETVLIDGERKMVSLRGMWRSSQIPFDRIRAFHVNRYRFKRNVFLYRLDVILPSGKAIRLIQDVPDQEALCSLGKRVGDLVKKPFNPGQ